MKFSDEIVQRVWEKARGMPDRDPIEWRKDECGAWINRGQYGNTISGFGWKIENTSPGGPDDLNHLRAFHCDNSFDRGTGQPHRRVTADREDMPPTSRIDSPRNKTVG